MLVNIAAGGASSGAESKEKRVTRESKAAGGGMTMSDNIVVAITGAAGFIGRHLVSHLTKRNGSIHIRALDRSWNSPVSRKFAGWDDVDPVQSDILDVPDLKEALEGVDVVVHLAAMLGVARTEGNPLGCLETNVSGTRKVLRACAAKGVRRIVYASSSEIYGCAAGADREKIKETDTFKPRSVYGVSKLAGEEFVKAYAEKHSLDYSILRFFNVYGPGQSQDFVIPKFAARLASRSAPQIYGTGNQIRAFCYISDVTEAIWLSLSPDAPSGEAFNIGNDTEPITIRELASCMVELSSVDVDPVHIPIEQSDRTSEREIYYRVPDINKARELLGYDPQVDLHTGVGQVLSSFAPHAQGKEWRRVASASGQP